MCGMKRKIYAKLLEWKRESADKYALLIEGARRVGKSYVAEEFARREYESHLILDFAKVKKSIKDLFEDKLDDLDDFFLQLGARTGVRLVPGKTLIVFDEVQRFPRAREAVKYLVADGRYHYLETGSLISLRKNVEDIVIPSEEMKIQMYPMDFEELLMAIGKEGLLPFIKDRFARLEPMGQADHRAAMELFRQYLVVGGMPQAVAAFSQGRDLDAAEKAKRMILDLYFDDIGKFAGRQKNRVRAIWRGIPGLLSQKDKRFSPGSIQTDSRSRDYESAFEWLEESMTVNLCRNVTDPNVGLMMTEESSSLKCYMGDTGLLLTHAYSENPAAEAELARRILIGKLEVNRGLLMENVVAQMLRAAGQKLYFHSTHDREKSENRMEIDFLLIKSKVSNRRNVLPIEVKSANDYTTSSLEKFKRKFPGYVCRSVVLHPGDIKIASETVYLPLYMAPFVMDMDYGRMP